MSASDSLPASGPSAVPGNDLARSIAPGSRRTRPPCTAPVTASVRQVLAPMGVPAVAQNGRLAGLAATRSRARRPAPRGTGRAPERDRRAFVP